MTIEVMDTKWTPRRIFEHLERSVADGSISESMATGQFESLIKKGVSTRALKAYRDEPVHYEKAVDMGDASNAPFEEYPVLGGLSDDGNVSYVPEGEELPELKWSTDSAVIRNVTIGFRCVITHQLFRFDKTGEIKRRASQIGKQLRRWEDIIVANFYNNGNSVNCYDGTASFNSAGHPNKTGGAANTNNINISKLGSVSEASVEALTAQIALWKGPSGENILIDTDKIVYAVDQHPNVFRLLRSSVQVGGTNATPNVWMNMFEPVPFKRLDRRSWFLKTDMEGYMWQWVDKPAVDIEARLAGTSFTNLVNQYRAFEISGFGNANWRAGAQGNY